MKKLVKLISILCLNILSIHIYGQNELWQKSFGGSSGDEFTTMAHTSDNGLILAGNSTSPISGNKSENTIGDEDLWIIKLDEKGDIEWQNTIGSNKQDLVYSIAQTSDGGYLIGSLSEGGISGDKTVNNTNLAYSDIWLIKLDNAGNILWQKGYGGSEQEAIFSIIENPDGTIILGCESESEISGNKTEPNFGLDDFWILKLTSTGDIIWQKSIGGDNLDNINEMILLSDGNILLGGYSSSTVSGLKTAENYGGEDFWVVKIDQSGNILWDKTYGGIGWDYINSIIQVSNREVLLTGSSYSGISGNKTTPNMGGFDGWAVKIDMEGNILKQESYGGIKSDHIKSSIKISDNSYLLGGYSWTGPTNGYFDYKLIEVDSSLNIKSIAKLGGTKDDKLIKLIISNTGAISLGGYSSSPTGFGKTSEHYGARDFWVLRTNNGFGKRISGKVFASKNNICDESDTIPLPNIPVLLKPSLFFGLTDRNGNYSIIANGTTESIEIITPKDEYKSFEIICPEQKKHFLINDSLFKDTAHLDFNVQIREIECTKMSIKIFADRKRPCFISKTTIRYSNLGAGSQTNGQIILKVPEFVKILNASVPYIEMGNNTIRFNVTNILPNQTYSIEITDSVICDLSLTGNTACFFTSFSPKNQCVYVLDQNYDNWDKSEIQLNGACLPNAVRYFIKNIGQNMLDSCEYRIYKDGILALKKKIKLIAGDSVNITFVATDHTYRMEVDQPKFFPEEKYISLTFDNCGSNNTRSLTNARSNNNQSNVKDEICVNIVNSLDPNDKAVVPFGIGADKKVEHKIPLIYTIRFQNTGTDTAFNVIIDDTISNNIDPKSLKVLMSSHPYEIETYSNKPLVMRFKFKNINLVDSITNELESHGWIRLEATPYDSIPNGTIVNNTAYIYFDFNPPIVTNTSWVTIDDNIPANASIDIITDIEENKFSTINIFPNPFSKFCRFQLPNSVNLPVKLLFFNAYGEQISIKTYNESGFIFIPEQMSTGIYFYSLFDKNDIFISRGKINYVSGQ